MRKCFVRILIACLIFLSLVTLYFLDWSKVGTFQNIIAAVIATVAAVVYNWHKHNHDMDQYKGELFFSFNERYRTLHPELQTAVGNEAFRNLNFSSESEDVLLAEEIHRITVFGKYLRLYSEQYYWHKKDLVEPEVWATWSQGAMHWYKHSSGFRKFVQVEKEMKRHYYNKTFFSLFPDN